MPLFPPRTELSEAEQISLDAFVRAIAAEARLCILGKRTVVDDGDLQGYLLHAAAMVAAAYVHRFPGDSKDPPRVPPLRKR